jgi:hypothetical protein
MPTLTQIQLPVPKSWEEFEDIVASAINTLRPARPPQRYGRRGQSQYGVDILFEDFLTWSTGIQCKCVNGIKLKEIEAEVAKAEQFLPQLESYIIAVTISRDARLHKQVNKLSYERSRNNKFRVGIWFWEDVAFFLSRDPTELARHYPQMFASTTTTIASLDGIQIDITRRRVEALNEMWALRHRIVPRRRHSDMDWDEALEDIAMDLDSHAVTLHDAIGRIGAILPSGVTDLLRSAATVAEEGSFEVSLSDDDDFEVPREAREAAGRMYDLLTDAITQIRADLTNSGLRLE